MVKKKKKTLIMTYDAFFNPYLVFVLYTILTSTRKGTRTAAMRFCLATVEKAVAAEPGGAFVCISEQE